MDFADCLQLAIEGLEGGRELVAQDQVGGAAAEEAGLPVEHGEDGGVVLQAGRIEHDGDIQGFTIVILGEGDEMVDALEIEIGGIVFAQSRGKIVDDDGLVGVSDFAEKATREFGEAIALGPRIEFLGEARGAGDEIVRRLNIAAREGDVFGGGDQTANAGIVCIDERVGIGDGGDGLHRAVDDGEFFRPGEAGGHGEMVADRRGNVVHFGVTSEWRMWTNWFG